MKPQIEYSHEYDERPWGSYTVLDEGQGYKVKRIEVAVGKRLSYQKHTYRSEHWYVVKGVARVTIDGKDIDISVGGTIDVSVGSAHRVENIGSELLVFIEIQRGSYLGEDDIVRIEDDFGRNC